jgi:DNA helicase-4
MKRAQGKVIKLIQVLLIEVFLITVFVFVVIKRKRYKQLIESEEVIINLKKTECFSRELEAVKTEYIVHEFNDEMRNKYESVFHFFNKKPYSALKDSRIDEFKRAFKRLDSIIEKYNEIYVSNELKRCKSLFDDIDGKSLDEQQRRAIVVDETNNLVLAGAGSGKTLTISGKVKYLVDKKGINPKEILLISFTRKAADEMRERIVGRLGLGVEVMTFHKLGLDIITKNNEKRPDVCNEMKKMVDDYFKTNFRGNKKLVENLITFFGCYLHIPKNWSDFKNLGEYHDYYRNVDYKTLKGKFQTGRYVREGIENLKIKKQTLQGETVKSLEEVMIANFLFVSGIDYIYEYLYPYESDDLYRKRYRPDFYLPKYDIYIEHFGIDINNKAPWLTQIEERKYLDGMVWKRQFHKENGTRLLETYSHYNNDGILLEKLREILEAEGVAFEKVDYEKLFDEIYNQQKNRYFEEFKKLLCTFIGLFKSKGYIDGRFLDFEKSSNEMDNKFMRTRSKLFFSIARPIHRYYQEYLDRNDMIDFNDMINNATRIVKSDDYRSEYKYIIIDEYQDISYGRYRLIKAIKDKTNSKIMCVGDDWQSIYRFAGSDISLFTDFSKHFGYSELLKIEKTYRNSRQLIDVAARFIQKNKIQYKKELRSDNNNDNPIRILGYGEDIFEALIKAITEIVHLFGDQAEILMLGRNNFDVEFFKTNKDFKLIKKSDGETIIKYRLFPNLRISYLTVHRAKGLESDNVIVINLENKLLGFPNQISDDPLLSFVLTGSDEYPFAEERRLFYVAMTRTRNTTYMMAPDKNMSSFVEELIKESHVPYELMGEESSIQEHPNCPKCQKGYLVLRKNASTGKPFLGCTNYPHCDLTIKNIEILNDQIKCPACGGYMVRRKGRFGEFYGCTNYPLCRNTIKIEEKEGDFVGYSS